jgi:deazaflavin-dependent oxidoreductase (nitroreductase family)
LLLMTARGVKSGEPITTPLVYHREDDKYVVAGSMGGAPHNPKWVANLRAHPEVEVEIAKDGGTERFQARARVIDSGPDRDRLYADHAKVWAPFLDYEKKTERTIPVVMLERLPS